MLSLIFEPFHEETVLKSTLNLLFFVLAGAPLGFLLIQKKSSLVSESLSHALLPGIAISAGLGGISSSSLMMGALLWMTLIALGTSYFVSRRPERTESLIFLVSISGNALGVCLLKWLEIPLDLTHLLFGSPLLIAEESLLRNLIALSVLVIALHFAWKKLLFFMFDANSASLISGRQSPQFYFLALLGGYLVLGFESLGVMSTAGTLILPAFFASLNNHMSKAWLFTAYFIGLLSICLSQILSYHLEFPLGPSMTLALVICGTCVTLLLKFLKK